jgi:hypothetical protein
VCGNFSVGSQWCDAACEHETAPGARDCWPQRADWWPTTGGPARNAELRSSLVRIVATKGASVRRLQFLRRGHSCGRETMLTLPRDAFRDVSADQVQQKQERVRGSHERTGPAHTVFCHTYFPCRLALRFYQVASIFCSGSESGVRGWYRGGWASFESSGGLYVLKLGTLSSLSPPSPDLHWQATQVFHLSNLWFSSSFLVGSDLGSNFCC